MPDLSRGMQVLTSDGELLGTVDHPSGGGFTLKRMGSGETTGTIPDLWVHRVDEHVHLNRTGAEAVAGLKSLSFKTSSGERPGAVREDGDETRPAGNQKWLLFIILALIVAAVVAFVVFQGR